MRYTIHGFSQRVAKEIGLEVQDLLLLRWLVDFSATGQMEHKEIKGSIYYWVNYQTICDDLPILSMQKVALYRRFKKMCDSKVLKHQTVKVNGTYSYYGFGEVFKTLISDNFERGYDSKVQGGMTQKSKGVRLKSSNKDSSINNSSIKETHTASANNSQSKELCVEIQQILGEKISQKKVQELINESSLEVVKQYIDNWDKYKTYAKKTQSAYFIYCIQHQLQVPTSQATTYNSGSIPPYADFDQREYKEEDMKKFYANLQD